MHTIFFDFGNVVAYFDHRVAVRQVRPHCELDDEAIFAAIYNTDLEDAFEAGRMGGEEFVRRACRAIGYRGGREEFRSAFVDIFTPNPDVCALIPRLKPRYRLVLASNTNELHAACFRSSFADVLRHFDAIGLSYEVGARKPHPQFFAHCQRLTDALPQTCLFIDDLPENVAGARAFGWHAVQYTSYPNLLRDLRRNGIAV
jgi:putative hydrolase of the HAD superfamily